MMMMMVMMMMMLMIMIMTTMMMTINRCHNTLSVGKCTAGLFNQPLLTHRATGSKRRLTDFTGFTYFFPWFSL